MPETQERLIRIGNSHGHGVFACTDIPPGVMLMSVHGKNLKFQDAVALGDNESFCVQVGMDDYIFPEPPFYLTNHSCEPNSGLNAQMELVSLREIKDGEEIVWDYSTSMLERHWTMPCECGAFTCRKIVTDFDLLPRALQERYLNMGIVLPFIVTYLSEQRQ